LLFLLLCSTVIADSGEIRRTAERSVTPSKKTGPLTRALEMARSSQASLEKVKDYEATFNKREIVRNRLIVHSMRIKNRAKPFSVYLRFNSPHDGREVIYFKGRNSGNLLAHETGLRGLAGTIPLSPTSSQALSESQHPITSIGMWNLLDQVIEQWELESNYGEINVKRYPKAKLGRIECTVIESSHPRPRRQFKYHRTRLFINNKTNLPFRVEQYGFPRRSGSRPPLLARYDYSNIKTNVGLTDYDFDTRNRNYRF